MHNDLNWEDLRFVLKVAETGSIAAAAKKLEVNRTTVLRRINHCEQALDCQLFDRRGNGYTLAPGAEQLLESAITVERTIDEIQRRILGKEILLEGTVRVTTTDSLLLTNLMPHLESFRQQHPKIVLEVVVSNHILSLSERDADIAIRPGKSIPDNLVGCQLEKMRFGLFASQPYIAEHTSTRFQDHRWIGIENPILGSPPGRWFSQNVPKKAVCIRTDSFVTMRAMAESGMGVALLPLKLARMAPELKRVMSPAPEISNNIWVVTHPDLESAVRVRAFMDHLNQVHHNGKSKGA